MIQSSCCTGPGKKTVERIYIPAGTPTWQQTLDKGKALNKTNVIDMVNFGLSWNVNGTTPMTVVDSNTLNSTLSFTDRQIGIANINGQSFTQTEDNLNYMDLRDSANPRTAVLSANKLHFVGPDIQMVLRTANININGDSMSTIGGLVLYNGNTQSRTSFTVISTGPDVPSQFGADADLNNASGLYLRYGNTDQGSGIRRDRFTASGYTVPGNNYGELSIYSNRADYNNGTTPQAYIGFYTWDGNPAGYDIAQRALLSHTGQWKWNAYAAGTPFTGVSDSHLAVTADGSMIVVPAGTITTTQLEHTLIKLIEEILIHPKKHAKLWTLIKDLLT